jgi:hypothetical protein
MLSTLYEEDRECAFRKCEQKLWGKRGPYSVERQPGGRVCDLASGVEGAQRKRGGLGRY